MYRNLKQIIEIIEIYWNIWNCKEKIWKSLILIKETWKNHSKKVRNGACMELHWVCTEFALNRNPGFIFFIDFLWFFVIFVFFYVFNVFWMIFIVFFYFHVIFIENMKYSHLLWNFLILAICNALHASIFKYVDLPNLPPRTFRLQDWRSATGL